MTVPSESKVATTSATTYMNHAKLLSAQNYALGSKVATNSIPTSTKNTKLLSR